MKYDHNDIDHFFSVLHEVPENVSIKKVHHLINHLPAKARLVDTHSIKPFLIMTSILTSLLVTSIWWFWPVDTADQLSREFDQKHNPEIIEESTVNEVPDVEPQELITSLPPVEESLETDSTDENREEPEVQLLEEPSESKEKEVKSGEVLQDEQLLSDCNWPSDTVITSDQMILKLTLDELLSLGFEYSEKENIKGLYYKNEYNGLVSAYYADLRTRGAASMRSSSVPVSSMVKGNVKENFSHYNFYPLFMTDFTGESKLAAVIPGVESWGARDTLVGVELSSDLVPKLYLETQIIWFNPTGDFLEALPERYGYLASTIQCVRELRKTTERVGVVAHKGWQLPASIRPLELSDDVLQQMGLEIADDAIRYEHQVNSDCGFAIFLGRGRYGVDMSESVDKQTVADLIFISNEKGRQHLKWSCERMDKVEKTNESFMNTVETLISVVLRKSNYPFLSEDQYLWFQANDELLELIPGEQGEQLRQEYHYVVAEDKSELTTSCTYFESCQATLHLHELQMFPNPTVGGEATVSFSLPEKTELTVSVANLQGNELLRVVTDKSFEAGSSAVELDVSSLKPGIYLMVIRNKNGFLTRRIMVQ